MAFNLQNRIKLFKRLIAKCKYANETKKACKDEIEYLRKQSLSISTIRGYLTSYRKEILGGKKSRKYKVWVNDGLKISEAEQREIQSNYAYKIAKQTGESQDNSLVEFSKQILSSNNYNEKKEQIATIKHEIKDLIGLVEKAKQLLSSQSYISVTLGLMALTGRRNTEILKTASFEYVNDLVLTFDGQLKTKGSESNRPYQIFTLCNSTLIIKALRKLRSMKDFSELKVKQINNKTSKTLSEKVKKVFGSYFGNHSIKAYDLRAIYAQTIYQLIHEKQGISNTASYAKSLGHVFEKVDSRGKKTAVIQTTSRSYDKFLIKDNDIEALKNNLL